MYMIAEVSQYVAVASFAEAWIEIHISWYKKAMESPSPPSRRRGLKSVLSVVAVIGVLSPPSRRRGLKFDSTSLPHRHKRSPPSRRRGLKSSSLSMSSKRMARRLLRGGVD